MEQQCTYKRLLVISNAAINDTDSNGRTLRNLLLGWDREKLAQFCTYGTPDLSLLASCYQVRDGDALRAFIKGKSYGGLVQDLTAPSVETVANRRIRKSPATALFRELIWRGAAWKSRFLSWVAEFEPEAILVFMGDSSYLMELAMEVAGKHQIPFVVYSCENYYFKDFNYITRSPSLLYGLLHQIYVRTVRRLAERAARFVFISEALMHCYLQEFPNISADYIMTASSMQPCRKANGTRITYAGNLGLGRHKPLIEIGNVLQQIDPELKITLFGRFPDAEIERQIKACQGIDYRGFVPYETVVAAIHDSRLLIHVEDDEPYRLKDLKYAFSTKISDCVASGVPLFCYAPKELPFTAFLKETQCAIVAHESDELLGKLRTALFDEMLRAETSKYARKTADLFFSSQKNTAKFKTLIDNL